jgi:transcriptional regulator with XRE-family HTH domain
VYSPKIDTCGNRIAQALKIREIKPADLCKLAKVPKSSLSLYMSGAYEPKQNRVYDMALALNVSEAWLMGYDVPMERESTPDQLFEKFEQLTEDDQRWLELGRRISPSTKEVAYPMIEKFDNLSEERKMIALIRILDALGHQ